MAKQKELQKSCNQEAIAKTSLDLGIPESVVREVVNFQGKYTENTILAGRFESVRLPYIGIFIARPERIQRINEWQGLLDESVIQTPK